MVFTVQDVKDYVEQDDVSFVRLAFCDVYGKQKNISIMVSELDRAFTTGIAIDASAIKGFGDEVKSDLFLHPDPATLAVLPWRPSSGRVVRMFCDIRHPDGTPFEMDARYILKESIAWAADKGISVSFGAEHEFYLFRRDENGYPTKVPHDNAGYMDIAPEDQGVNVRREICLTLQEMGILPESSHHEEGPGQHEIDFKYSDALSAADNSITFKGVVATIAEQYGLYADFSPKPLLDKSGNGLHINMSVHSKDGRDCMDAFMAGILSKVSEMTAFLNPLADSYVRLGRKKAPRYITWSKENRSQLIRIPAATGEYRRMELRSPDPASNPYLAFALLIRAGVEGILGEMTPPPANNLNLYKAAHSDLKGLETLPRTRQEAMLMAASSEFIQSVIPKGIMEAFMEEE